MKPVFVPKTPHDKALQRALMQWRKPQNRGLVLEALRKTGREDLIGYGKHCLVRPDKGQAAQSGVTHWEHSEQKGRGKGKPAVQKSGKGRGEATAKNSKKDTAQRPEKLVRKAGWAKPAPKKNARKKK